MHTHICNISQKKNTLLVILFYLLFFTDSLYVNCFRFLIQLVPLVSCSYSCGVILNSMLYQFTYCVNGVCCYLLYVFGILMESSYRRRSSPATEPYTYTHPLWYFVCMCAVSVRYVFFIPCPILLYTFFVRDKGLHTVSIPNSIFLHTVGLLT